MVPLKYKLVTKARIYKTELTSLVYTYLSPNKFKITINQC